MTILSYQSALDSCEVGNKAKTKSVNGLAGGLTAYRAALGLAMMALLLGGCGANRVTKEAEVSADGKSRHPIALVNQPYSIDVFPTGSVNRLDQHTDSQVASFAQRYKQIGRGPISIMIPSSLRGTTPVENLRRSLAHNGAVAPVTVSHYAAENTELAAPVRLSFDGIKAKVVHRCGDWPNDLASGSSVAGWENKPYWNFGCANQAMLASQVADPRDIMAPSGETAPDAAMVLRGITNVRQGKDPATQWSVKNTHIGRVGD